MSGGLLLRPGGEARRSLDAIAAQWDRALDRLKESLER